MSNLAIRVSRSYDDISEWINGIECDKIVVFQHDADDEVSRTHVHMLVVKSKCKPDALKTRYKKKYGDIDKTDWSFKDASTDYNKYITYMTKGVLPPIYNQGFDPVEVLNLAHLWVEQKTKKTTSVELQNGKLVRVVNESSKKTKREIIEQMRSRYQNSQSTRDILKMIRTVLIENNEVIGMYKVIDYYDALLMYADKSAWLDLIESKINSRIRI